MKSKDFSKSLLTWTAWTLFMKKIAGKSKILLPGGTFGIICLLIMACTPQAEDPWNVKEKIINELDYFENINLINFYCNGALIELDQ